MCTAKGETVRCLLSYTHCQLCLSGVPTSPQEGFSTAQNSDQSYVTQNAAHAMEGYHSLLSERIHKLEQYSHWSILMYPLPPGVNPIAVDKYIYIYIYMYYVSRIHLSLFSSHSRRKRLPWSRGSVLAFSTQVRGFKPGRSRRIFKGRKKSSARLPSEGK